MLKIGLSKDELLKGMGGIELTPEIVAGLIEKNNKAILEQLRSSDFARLVDERLYQNMQNTLRPQGKRL